MVAEPDQSPIARFFLTIIMTGRQQKTKINKYITHYNKKKKKSAVLVPTHSCITGMEHRRAPLQLWLLFPHLLHALLSQPRQCARCVRPPHYIYAHQKARQIERLRPKGAEHIPTRNIVSQNWMVRQGKCIIEGERTHRVHALQVPEVSGKGSKGSSSMTTG